MINKKEFEELRKEINDSDEQREEIIQLSREIISVSKQIIYAAQRDDFKTADSAAKEIRQMAQKLKKINIPLDTNMGDVALQEYAEAIAFYEFVKNKKIPTRKQLGISAEDYLCGISDLTGELLRKAVYDVIHKKYDEAEKIQKLVHDIYGEFLKLHLRNNELRKKSDSIKWNLKKLEEVMYDISIKGKHDNHKDNGKEE